MPLNAQSLELGPWRTVRYDIPVEECGQDELSDMQNTRIGAGGQVEQRRGTDSYQAAAALGGTPTLTMVAEYDVDASTTHVVIVAGAAIYKYSSGWSALTGATAPTAGDDNTFEWVNANGTLYMVNGVNNAPVKWDGGANTADAGVSSRFTVAQHIAWWDNRLWYGNVSGATSKLWYSDTATPETIGATSFFNFGGIITGLVSTETAMTVHTSEGIYTLSATGWATTPYRSQKRTSRASLSGRAAVALPNETQVFVTADGIYAWASGVDLESLNASSDTGGTVFSGGREIVKISNALDDGYWDSINVARLKQSFAVVFPRENEVWFALPYGSAQTNMNHIMVWNYRTAGWHGPYTGWERNCGALVNNKVHLGDLGGILWDHDDADEDDAGTAINAWFETGAPPVAGNDVKCRFLQARHYYDAKGLWSVTATQKSAELLGATAAISMRGTGFTLDSDVLDSDTQMAPEGQLSQDAPLLGYGTRSSVRISLNRAAQTFTYRRIILRARPEGLFGKQKPTE